MDDQPPENANSNDNAVPIIIDLLTDELPLIQNEAEWLIDLFGCDLARCLDAKF